VHLKKSKGVGPRGRYEVVQTMRVAPITIETVVQLAAATLIPIAPLLLTMMPPKELLKKLFSILFQGTANGDGTTTSPNLL
jgi:hypothetical protein